MLTETVTLGDLVDRTLWAIEAPTERGSLVTIGSTALSSSSTTDCTLSSGTLAVSDIIQFGAELALVTAVSDDSTPTYTLSRGYYNTVAAAHPTGTVGQKNPQFPRRRVADAIKRSLTRLEALGVPLVTTTQVQRTSEKQQATLPSDCRRVLQVMYESPLNGRVVDLDGWRQRSNMSDGPIITLPWFVMDADVLELVYVKPYAFSVDFPDEASTVVLPESGTDLPASYAAAFLVASREISRAEIDRSNEVTTQDQVRVQSGVGLMRALWQEFYRALDEVRRVIDVEVPKHRPLITRPKLLR